jgi:hypothetical protein
MQPPPDGWPDYDTDEYERRTLPIGDLVVSGVSRRFWDNSLSKMSNEELLESGMIDTLSPAEPIRVVECNSDLLVESNGYQVAAAQRDLDERVEVILVPLSHIPVQELGRIGVFGYESKTADEDTL